MTSFLDKLSSLRQDLSLHGWIIAWPAPRFSWSMPSGAVLQFSSLLAFLTAVFAPIIALRVSVKNRPGIAFAQILFLTFMGACLMAALADNPLTRVEIVPFRGIKMAFVLAWVGSLFSFYSWNEIKEELLQNVRRVDILSGVAVAAVLGYVLIRMGNASAGWKPGWEQGLRDRLEDLLVARPRFKEFAIGYPLLLVGLSLPMTTRKTKPFWHAGRFWIAVGMIGPISMVNTFCHLHSPLYLAFWRSFNGCALGALMGLALLAVMKWLS